MTSVLWQLLVPAVTLCLSAQLAWAQDAAAPLFPEVIVPTDDSMSGDPELAAFRATLAEAARAHVRTGQGRLHDPSRVLNLMAGEVEFFVAQGPDANFSSLDFVSLGVFAPEKALEMLGRLDRNEATTDPIVQQRYAMWAVEEILGDPTIGKSPWLDDRICTASYGKLTWLEWLPLWQALRYDLGEWVIASAGDFSGISQLKRFQMVAVSPEQKRSAGWLGIMAPFGGGEFFRQDEAYFAPYLNNHLCFGKLDGEWRVTAIAYRLD
jgi:hypothetical protein